jgi:hypothetical protein
MVGKEPVRRRAAVTFSRYSALSLLTVPVGYSLFLLARQLWDVNAGLLNLAVGNVLTVPSFFMYRWLVWREGSGRGIPAELFSFWQTVMVGALASSAFMAVVDLLFDVGGAVLILAGLTGQGIIFIARFVWLDRVTFSRGPAEPVGPAEPAEPAGPAGPAEPAGLRE